MKILARIALALCVAAALAAETASAASVVSGNGHVQAHDPAARVVYIDGRSFSVGPDVKLLDSNGKSFAFADLELPAKPDAPGIFRLYIGQYEALDSPKGPVLIKLTLIEGGE